MAAEVEIMEGAGNDFVAGSVAGAAQVIVGYPLDTIKIRLQLSESTKYTGTFDCINKIIKQEGVKSLFRGILSPLIFSSVINAMVFTTYQGSLKLICGGDANPDPATHTQRFIAGAISGIPQSFVLGPSDLIKIRMQQDSVQYKGNLEVLQKTWANEGFKGMFRGTWATILRETPGLGAEIKEDFGGKKWRNGS